MEIKVGILGATGYTGFELVRLIDQHPQVEIAFLTSETSAGQSLRKSWPQALDLVRVFFGREPDVDAEVRFVEGEQVGLNAVLLLGIEQVLPKQFRQFVPFRRINGASPRTDSVSSESPRCLSSQASRSQTS